MSTELLSRSDLVLAPAESRCLVIICPVTICSPLKNISSSPNNAYLEGSINVWVCELKTNYQWGTISGNLFSSEKKLRFSANTLKLLQGWAPRVLFPHGPSVEWWEE